MTNTASFALGQTERIDYDAGFGILNYSNARKSFATTHNQVLTESYSSGDLVFSENIQLPLGSTINVQNTILFNSNNSSTNVSNISHSQFKIELSNVRTNQIVAVSDSRSNFTFLAYSSKKVNESWFTIKVYLIGEKIGAEDEYFSIGYYISENAGIKISSAHLDYPIYGVIDGINQENWYKFVAPVSGNYSFSSRNGHNAYATLLDENMNVLADDISGDPMNFYISMELMTGQKVFLKTRCYFNEIAAHYMLSITVSGFQSLSLETPKSGELESGKYVVYRFTAPLNGKYTFNSSNNLNVSATLYNNHFDYLAGDISGDPMGFYITSHLEAGQVIYIKVFTYYDDLYARYILNISRASSFKNILTTDYGFENQYFFDERTKDITTASGLQFTTNRLRCGYIQEQYLTLSANRRDAGTAFLEFYFTQDVLTVDFGIALWSSTENIVDDSADIIFQYQDINGNWIEGKNFSLASMSKSKDILDDFHYEFTTRVTAFRIYVTTTNTGGDNNKGRVVIGNITIKLGF